jgi:excinuclease ABC subunit B
MRRRQKQLAYNEANGIDPQTVRKKVTDILEMIRLRDSDDMRPSAARGRSRGRGRSSSADRLDLPRDELARLIQNLTDEMQDAARDLRFEEAARLRDEIHELKRELREVG